LYKAPKVIPGESPELEEEPIEGAGEEDDNEYVEEVFCDSKDPIF